MAIELDLEVDAPREIVEVANDIRTVLLAAAEDSARQTKKTAKKSTARRKPAAPKPAKPTRKR